MVKRLAKKVGILIDISSGAAFWVTPGVPQRGVIAGSSSS